MAFGANPLAKYCSLVLSVYTNSGDLYTLWEELLWAGFSFSHSKQRPYPDPLRPKMAARCLRQARWKLLQSQWWLEVMVTSSLLLHLSPLLATNTHTELKWKNFKRQSCQSYKWEFLVIPLAVYQYCWNHAKVEKCFLFVIRLKKALTKLWCWMIQYPDKYKSWPIVAPSYC